MAAIVKESEAGIVNNTTVEEIDRALTDIAATCRHSSPELRALKSRLIKPHPEDILRPVVARMPAREMKWFVRIFLKQMQPVIINEISVMRCVDPLLPNMWHIRSNFPSVLKFLKRMRAQTDHLNSSERERQIENLVKSFKPEIGFKIGRPKFLKARSIQHCVQLVGPRTWSVELKFDGEYCQVHVDITRGDRCIQIFSKSGRDSTEDREALHGYIKQSLRIDGAGSRSRLFKTKCILEGGMVVFDSRSNDILEFHKIRKHVSRAGSFLGTENDSQAHA